MAKVTEFNQFIAEDESCCDAWMEGDVLHVCTGDDTVDLDGEKELEQFIHFLRATRKCKIDLGGRL